MMTQFFKPPKEAPRKQEGHFLGGNRTIFQRILESCTKSMHRQTECFSTKTWKVGLVFFVLSFGGYSAYLGISVFTGKSNINYPLFHIRSPRYLTAEGPERQPDPLKTDSLTRHIHHFRLYMDSLARCSIGKSRYDSLVQLRPGLMDSILLLENNLPSLKP